MAMLKVQRKDLQLSYQHLAKKQVLYLVLLENVLYQSVWLAIVQRVRLSSPNLQTRLAPMLRTIYCCRDQTALETMVSR